MSNVISMYGDGAEVCAGVHIDPNNVLSAALEKLENVVVLGWEKDGTLYVAASDGPADTILLLEAAKAQILDALLTD